VKRKENVDRGAMMNRRNFLRAAGVVSVGAVGAVGSLELAQRLAGGKQLGRRLVASNLPIKEMHIGFTDGFVSMPALAEQVAPFYPDPAAPRPYTT
jgi:hypothetical protein